MRGDKNSNVTKTRVRCATCGGGFGLIRHRLAHRQFCSKHCLEQYLANRKQKLSNLSDFSRA
jgi:endogenous inhibitor of DNA gyrase (YacG/DUF329 family)